MRKGVRWNGGVGLASLLSASLVCCLLCGCGLSEIRDRRKQLASLAATNASLAEVESALHLRFAVERQTSPTTNLPVSKSSAPARAVGHTSSISMQTWIFLDDHDRLVGFEVRAQ